MILINPDGFFELQLPHRLQQMIYRVNQRQTGGTYGRAFAMGVLSTLIVSPCVTAPLVGVLMYIAQTGDKVLGASALFMMGLGMGIPLLLMGTSAGHYLPKRGPWMNGIKQFMGFLMIAMAIWLLSRLLSLQWTLLLWSLLMAGGVGFLSQHFFRRFIHSKKWRHGVSLLLSITGMLAVIGSAVYLPASTGHPVFNTVHSVAELEKAIKMAKSLHRPVMVDFYADWCESCVAMDKKVFNDKAVKKTLASYTLLRADLTANATEDHALMKKYNVIAPPTILFFDSNGHELLKQRIVGEVDVQLFLARMQRD